MAGKWVGDGRMFALSPGPVAAGLERLRREIGRSIEGGVICRRSSRVVEDPFVSTPDCRAEGPEAPHGWQCVCSSNIVY